MMNACQYCGKQLDEKWIVCPYCLYVSTLKCHNCYNEISKEWNICPYCTELLSNNLLRANKNVSPKNDFKVKTPSEIIICKSKLSYYISWGIIGFVYFFIYYLLEHFYDESMSFTTMLIGSYLLFAQNTIIIYWSKFFEMLYPALETFVETEELEQWYKNELAVIFSLKNNTIFGFLFSISAIFLLIIPNLEFNFIYTALFFYIGLFLALFALGSGIYFLIATFKFLFHLTKLPLKIHLYQHPLRSLKTVGKLFVKIFYLGSLCIYVPWIIAILYSTIEINFKIISFYSFMGIFLGLYFFIPQYRIHKLIVATKRNKEFEIGSYLNQIDDVNLLDFFSLKYKHLSQLHDLKEIIGNMDEWAFNEDSILKIISAIVLPSIIILIEIWKLLK